MDLMIGGWIVTLHEERDGYETAWVAEARDLPGCYCAEYSPGAAVAHIKQSITDWLETNVPVNVREYGAVGDGIQDDTDAIQAALDAAAKKAESSRKEMD